MIEECDTATIVGNHFGDNQTWTATTGFSFQPQSSVAGLLTVYSVDAGRVSRGQYIKLVNANGGVDVTVFVQAINPDESITVYVPSPTSLSSGSNTTALTGTWSGSGTTITGSGTLATTQLNGGVWVTNGSEWRRVTKALTNTSILIDRAFTTPLSGASLSQLRVTAQGIPSQQNGVRLFGLAANVLLQGNNYTGNVLDETNISTPSNMLPGSEYFRTTVTTTNTLNQNLMTQIPWNARLCGITATNTIAISGGGAASYELRLTDGTGVLIQTYKTGIALLVSTVTRGTLTAPTVLTDTNIVRAIFTGGTPSAGQITLKAYFKVEAA